jgi:hypothetical protein
VLGALRADDQATASEPAPTIAQAASC